MRAGRQITSQLFVKQAEKAAAGAPRHGHFDPQNLVRIRWLALSGQLAACLIIYFGLGFSFPLDSALGVIFTSALVNLAIDQRNRYIPVTYQIEILLALAFDVLQLAALIYLTGGLLNPFFILLLAPLVVSAAVLELKATISLLLLVIISASFLSVYHLPLPWAEPDFDMPQLFLFGILSALVISAVFISLYTWYLADNRRQLASLLNVAQLDLAQERESLALGRLATAAAHKLGSPLNTIYVISHELTQELEDDDPLLEDVQMLTHEIDRCRVILSELDADANLSSSDLAFGLPISEVIHSLISPKLAEMKTRLAFEVKGNDDEVEPLLQSRPELKYALETILDNADGFAKSLISFQVSWNDNYLFFDIKDDGPGFNRAIMNRFGQPFNSTRKGQDGHRGLGLYLAMSLIESVGGTLSVKNQPQSGGHVVIIVPRAYIEAQAEKG